LNFFTISGVAANRGSPGSISLAIAILVRPKLAASMSNDLFG